jgi:integrase/recombinase XerD
MMNDRAMRVRVGGPLGPYADGFRRTLAERGYAPSSVAGQLQLMAHLSGWLVDRGLDSRDLVSPVVGEFLQARRGAGYRQWLSMRGVAPLLDYLRGVGVAPTRPSVVAAGAAEVRLDAYEAYLVTERGLAASTVRNYLHVARQFLSGRWVSRPPDLNRLTAVEVREYVLAGCRSGGGSVTLLVVGMRALLRYLYLAGVTPTALAGAVPAAASWPAGSLPGPIDGGQAARLLNSCDRGTAVGRRDFAALTLQLRLGLRVGEIAALELSDIDWRHGEILVRGKGNRVERLPLPADVGEAVADWLRHGRTRCTCTRVFTTVAAPTGALTGKAVSAIVKRAARRADLPTVTAHRLRHTAATDLLRAGAELTEVGQVLRHASVLSTATYARVDHAALCAVVRPWPAGAR